MEGGLDLGAWHQGPLGCGPPVPSRVRVGAQVVEGVMEHDHPTPR